MMILSHYTFLSIQKSKRPEKLKNMTMTVVIDIKKKSAGNFENLFEFSCAFFMDVI